MKVLRNSKGFTLIELIIIIIILGILAAVAVPKYVDMKSQAADAAAKGVLGALRSANSIFFSNNLINNTTTAYSINALTGQIELQGVDSSGMSGGNFLVTISGNSYSFSMNPTEGQAPTTFPNVTAVGRTW